MYMENEQFSDKQKHYDNEGESNREIESETAFVSR